MKLHMVAAVAKTTFAMGNQGKLPWHNPDDLAMFKRVTDGHHIIVGKRTADSLPPLERRTVHIWDGKRLPQDFLIDLEETGIREAWLCGGAYTYECFAPFVNGCCVVSYIEYNGPADTFFDMEAYGI